MTEAKAAELPKKNIEKAIHSASDSGDASQFISGIYTVVGNASTYFIVQTLSDSPNRVVKQIKSIANKAEVKMANANSVFIYFNKMAIFRPIQAYDEEQVLTLAIDEEIDIDFGEDPNDSNSNNEFQVILTEADNMKKLQLALIKADILGTANIEYVPLERVDVNDSDSYQKNIKLIEDFGALEDVEAVFHNMNINE